MDFSADLLFIEDPGHGWLRVNLDKYPRAIECGTGYGYLNAFSADRHHIYLEEDCELARFLELHPEVNFHDVPADYVSDFPRHAKPNQRRYDPFAAATVKRATLFDGVTDTYQTESELNGYRPSQGALL